jgi:hypothetical protein
MMLESADVQIRQLEGTSKENFEKLVNYIKTFYPIPDEYEKLERTVKEVFDVDPTSVKVGSVAAYFVGCNLSSKMNPSGCSLTCINGAPLSGQKGDGDNVCQYPVFSAIKESSDYKLYPLNNISYMDKAIVYFSSNASDLSLKDKQEMEKKGIKEVNFIHFSINAKGVENYEEITKGFVPLNDIPTRGVSTIRIVNVSGDSEAKGDNNTTMFWIVIVVLFILVIVFFLYKKNKKSESGNSAMNMQNF